MNATHQLFQEFKARYEFALTRTLSDQDYKKWYPQIPQEYQHCVKKTSDWISLGKMPYAFILDYEKKYRVKLPTFYVLLLCEIGDVAMFGLRQIFKLKLNYQPYFNMTETLFQQCVEADVDPADIENFDYDFVQDKIVPDSIRMVFEANGSDEDISLEKVMPTEFATCAGEELFQINGEHIGRLRSTGDNTVYHEVVKNGKKYNHITYATYDDDVSNIYIPTLRHCESWLTAEDLLRKFGK
ncbi:MAG: hypothetical protein K1X54_14410 [Flavobacteriales bacterium]|nr:hypothetical protein [Flavobacteriales bacterium]